MHFFICRPLDSIVKEDAGIELRTAATLALSVRRSDLLYLLLDGKISAMLLVSNHFEKKSTCHGGNRRFISLLLGLQSKIYKIF